jgi:hypothetical protein
LGARRGFAIAGSASVDHVASYGDPCAPSTSTALDRLRLHASKRGLGVPRSKRPVAVPAYRARRRSAARRAALTTQHLLLVRLAAHLADEINTRYDLDRFVLYAIPPQGGPVTYSDPPDPARDNVPGHHS